MVQSLSHITLMVRDLEKSSEIITRILGGKLIYNSHQKNHSIAEERFFDINGLWFVLMQHDEMLEKSYNHIAFRISADEIPRIEKEVMALGLEILPSRPRQKEEGLSIYFYDYDHHLFELHTGTLEERLSFYQNH